MSTNDLIIACPHCHSLNRVPVERLAEQPNCGRCHKALFTGSPVELNDASFDRHAGRSSLPLLVDFWAPWCGPCKVMAPQFEQAARTLEPRMRLAKVNTEAEQALGARYGIRSIPTMVLFHEGRELARQSGAMNTSDIVRWVTARLGA